MARRPSPSSADPPYNVPIEGPVCGLGRIRHPDFALGCGEMSEAEFTAFLATAFRRLAGNRNDGVFLLAQVLTWCRHGRNSQWPLIWRLPNYRLFLGV